MAAEQDLVTPFFKVQEDVNGVLMSGTIVDDKIKSYVMGFDVKDKIGKYDLEVFWSGRFEKMGVGFLVEQKIKTNYYFNEDGELTTDFTLEIRR